MSPGHPPETDADNSAAATERADETPLFTSYNAVSTISPEAESRESLGGFPQTSSHLLSRQPENQKSVTVPRHRRPFLLLFGWWWEVCAILVGLICMCLTIAILFYTNGKPLKAWGLPIQPNSLIAVFSAITRSALLVPIAECISQLAWVYYDKPKAQPLSRMQYFHDASRGPWGSTVLFWKTRTAPPLLALFGAGITVVMLLFEPFAQQVLEFPTRNAPIDNSLGSATYTLSWLSATANETFYTQRASLISDLGLAGLVHGQPSLLSDGVQCLTDECRLPKFTSLALCSVCESQDFEWGTLPPLCSFELDTTVSAGNLTAQGLLDLVQERNKSAKSDSWYTNFTMRCRIEKTGFAPVNLTVDNYWMDLSGEQVFPWQEIIPFSEEEADGQEEGDQDTTGWCHRNTSTPGVLDGDVLQSIDQPVSCCKTAWEWKDPFTDITQHTCFETTSSLNNSYRLENIQNTKFKVTWCALQLCAKSYDQVTIEKGALKAGRVEEFRLSIGKNISNFTGWGYDNLTYDFTFTNEALHETFTIGNYSRDILKGYIQDRMGTLWQIHYMDFIAASGWQKFFDALTTVASALIRSPANPNATTIYGPAYEKQTFVNVRWVWLVLPLCLIVCSVFFLIMTAWQSREKPYLYKTSILPFLFHPMSGLQKESPDQGVGEGVGADQRETPSDLLKVAKDHRARLNRCADGNVDLEMVD